MTTSADDRGVVPGQVISSVDYAVYRPEKIGYIDGKKRDGRQWTLVIACSELYRDDGDYSDSQKVFIVTEGYIGRAELFVGGRGVLERRCPDEWL